MAYGFKQSRALDQLSSGFGATLPDVAARGPRMAALAGHPKGLFQLT